MLTDELQCLERGEETSERLLVFISWVLQKDRLVNRGHDIKRLRLGMWREGLFNDYVI